MVEFLTFCGGKEPVEKVELEKGLRRRLIIDR